MAYSRYDGRENFLYQIGKFLLKPSLKNFRLGQDEDTVSCLTPGSPIGNLDGVNIYLHFKKFYQLSY